MQTVPAVLAATAARFADRPALVDPPLHLTYRELHERVRRAAHAFTAFGVRPGDRVAICSPNTHHWVVAALGALSAGAALVPVNTRYTGPEIHDVVTRSGADTLVVAGPFLGVDRLAELRKAGPGPRTVIQIRSTATWSGPPRTGRRRGRAGRRQRHPVHLRHHRPQQGSDERPPPDLAVADAWATLAASPRTTATW